MIKMNLWLKLYKNPEKLTPILFFRLLVHDCLTPKSLRKKLANLFNFPAKKKREISYLTLKYHESMEARFKL